MAGVSGIDPSLTGTGLAHWDGTHWERHTVASKGHNTDTYHQTTERLDRILVRVVDWLGKREPDLVVLEWPAYSSNTGHATDRAGLFHLIAHEIRGWWPATALAYCDPRGRICYGLGKFAGSKDAVLAAAIKRYPDADIRNNNEADAVLLAAMGGRWLGEQPGFVLDLAETAFPQTNVRGMGRVQWPLSLKG